MLDETRSFACNFCVHTFHFPAGTHTHSDCPKKCRSTNGKMWTNIHARRTSLYALYTAAAGGVANVFPAGDSTSGIGDTQLTRQVRWATYVNPSKFTAKWLKCSSVTLRQRSLSEMVHISKLVGRTITMVVLAHHGSMWRLHELGNWFC